MSFRTIGLFGPRCPEKLQSYQIPDRMRLSQNPVGNDFPLELAMKIFWEAEMFYITASVVTKNGDGIFTQNVAHSFPWGSWRYHYYGVDRVPGWDDRPSATNAKDLLCRDYHTFSSVSTSRMDNGVAWQSNVWCLINRVPFAAPSTYQTDAIYAPFRFYIDNTGLTSRLNGIILSPFRGVGQTETEGPSANIETPWGNYSCPTRIGIEVESVSMTITVTASDPTTRYGDR